MIVVRMGDIEIDDQVVLDAMDNAKQTGARRTGFRTRELAMNSITDNAGPSRPGQPPHSHLGFIKRGISYDYDESTSTMVVGPKLMSRRSGNVTNALEYGGYSKTVRGNSIRILARPFMSPAFGVIVQNDVPAVFENTFH